MKKFLSILMLSILLLSFVATTALAEEKNLRLVDEADLLSSTEEAEILSRLDEISQKYEYEFVIVTTETTGKLSATKFADNFVANGFSGKNVVMLLVFFNNNEREWQITCSGEAKAAVDEGNKEHIFDSIQASIGDDDYSSAFGAFIDECDYYVNGYINGFPFDATKNLIIAVAIGFVIAFITVSIMKGKLKSVEFQKNAANYVKPGSMNITQSRDFFLYRTVTRTAKPKNNSSSSGGNSHSSRKF